MKRDMQAYSADWGGVGRPKDTASMQSRMCPICDARLVYAFWAMLLNQHRVHYYACPDCGLVQTESPFWLEEAYAQPISPQDTGLLERNLVFSQRLEPFLHFHLPPDARGLDVSGGFGVFARLMRDKGFDFYTTDPQCPNLFAAGFEPNSGFTASVLTIFEVVEHVEDPREFIQRQMNLYAADTLVISTETYKGGVPGPDWWYYQFESGQHITFFRQDTLARLAGRLGLLYVELGAGLHLLTRYPLSALERAVMRDSLWGQMLTRWVRWRRKGLSRTWADHLEMKQRAQSAAKMRSS